MGGGIVVVTTKFSTGAGITPNKQLITRWIPMNSINCYRFTNTCRCFFRNRPRTRIVFIDTQLFSTASKPNRNQWLCWWPGKTLNSLSHVVARIEGNRRAIKIIHTKLIPISIWLQTHNKITSRWIPFQYIIWKENFIIKRLWIL